MHLGRTVDWVLLAVVSAHCLAAPFTKVEESLNAQAVHDVLYHRGDTAQYDHVEFPGVVPRSFAGAVALAAAASPVVALLHSLHVRAPRVLTR